MSYAESFPSDENIKYKFANMFDIETSKNVGDLATSEKSTNSEKLLSITQPLSERKRSLKKLAQFYYYYATLQTNTATYTISAYNT